MRTGRFNYRGALAFAHDVIGVGVTWYLAHLVRFNLSIPVEFSASGRALLFLVMPAYASVFYAFGLYRGIWRYASVADLVRILSAIALGSLITVMALHMLRGLPPVPRSVLLLHPIFLLTAMAGSRLAHRYWKEVRLYGPTQNQGQPVLVMGADEMAVSLVRELSRTGLWRVVGLLDNDLRKHNRHVHGVPVLGALKEVRRWAKEKKAMHAVIAAPSATPAERRELVELCTSADLRVLTVPPLMDLVSGKLSISQIRNVDVADLLGRAKVQLDDSGLRGLLNQNVVLVTGAGGSIGSELVRQIAIYHPGLLILLDNSEYALYSLEQELHVQDTQIECLIGDVKDEALMRRLFAKYRPHVVFHAAAYKHVPLMESSNTWQAVQNNVLGTWIVARAAHEFDAQKFVFVSTDKAVNPTSVMGASKRMAEMVCQAMQADSQTRFAIVRFGNVLGSTGSVIPKFRNQIAKGGPVTVTHPEVYRYFMSVDEAAQLVLQAGAMGLGGELFVMDMGEPVRILDLARDMIRLSGLTDAEVPIVFTGLRPGEKLFEELLATGEDTLPTPHPKLRMAKAKAVSVDWLSEAVAWLKTEDLRSDDEVRRELRRFVIEYRPARGQLRIVASSDSTELSSQVS